MIDRLRTKADEATIPVVVGDMATARRPVSSALVYLVFNTISNLLTQAEQVACFRNAARHLAPGGRFVIELWVPELRKLPPGSRPRSGTRSRATSGWTRTTSCTSTSSRITSTSATAQQAQLFRSPHRYIWPAELDLMAQLAGFELEPRHADWSGTEFTAGVPFPRIGVPPHDRVVAR